MFERIWTLWARGSRMTMIHTHVLNRSGGRGVRSPADAL
jgi:hypothetical protein